jgi:hypothetical protein
MNAFWASENFDAFIAFRSSQPGKLARNFPVQNEGLFRERITLIAWLGWLKPGDR